MSTKLDQIQTVLPLAQFENDADQAPLFVYSDLSETKDLSINNWSTLCTTKGVLTITGEQRLKFLQGQTTADCTKITKELASYGAFCNLKGRVIANFLAFDDEESTHLIMHQSLIPGLIEHLTKFAVFFRVTLTDSSDETLIIGEHLAEGHSQPTLSIVHSTLQTTIRLDSQRTLSVIPLSEFSEGQIQAPLNSERVWNVSDIQHRIAWISQQTSEQFLPQLLGLEELGGLSFEKGCYTGQEIIARMKYRGQLKRHMQGVEIQVNDLTTDRMKMLSIGSKLNTAEKNNVGQLINTEIREKQLIALVTLEEEFQAATQFQINEIPVELRLTEN